MSDDVETHRERMKSKGGLARVFNATRYSLQGFAAAWRDEHAFRQELLLVAPAVVGAALLPVMPTQKALLIACTLAILVVELLNSAIEAVVDLVTSEHHAMAKKAKDIGSAAVFLAIANAAVVWALVLWERFGR